MADNRALARVGNTVYLGGDFTEVAPELGAPGVAVARLAAFDATTGVPVASFRPQLDGKVYALVSDSSTQHAVRRRIVHGRFRHPRRHDRGAQGDAAHHRRRGAGPLSGWQRMYVGGQFQRFGRSATAR